MMGKQYACPRDAQKDGEDSIHQLCGPETVLILGLDGKEPHRAGLIYTSLFQR